MNCKRYCNSCCSARRIGVYVLPTNGFIDNGTNALFGVDPRIWNSLPNESIVLLKVRHTIPTTAGGLVVAIAVPTNGTVTTVGDGTTTVSSVPVTDVLGATFTGAEFATNTERLAYVNKCEGIIRTMDCCTVAAAGA